MPRPFPLYCKRGHPMSGYNLMVHQVKTKKRFLRKDGTFGVTEYETVKRECRTCKNQSRRERYHKTGRQDNFMYYQAIKLRELEKRVAAYKAKQAEAQDGRS